MPKKPYNKLGADQEAVHAEDAINLILPLRVYLFIYFKEKVAPFNYLFSVIYAVFTCKLVVLDEQFIEVFCIRSKKN